MLVKLMKKAGGVVGAISALISCVASPSAEAAAAYSYDDSSASYRTLYVDVAGGSEYFENGWLTPADATVTNLVKTGEGTLVVTNDFGALACDTLDIQSGEVDFSERSDRAAYAGLVEGRKTNLIDTSMYSDYNWRCWRHVAYNDYLVTNDIVSSTRLLYDGTKNEETGWTTNCLINYAGYIWNNSPTNETWAFASAVGGYWRLDIDGQRVVGQYDWSGSGYSDGSAYWDLVTNTVVLAPGPHRFEYRCVVAPSQKDAYGVKTGYWINNSGTFKEPDEVWSDNSGLMYNDKGVCSRLISDYKKLEDPGDGSLFTTTVPWPVFRRLKASAGTVLRSAESAEWKFSAIEGWPTIVCGSVEVADSWAFAAAEVGTRQFSISGTLSFLEGATVYFTGPGDPPTGGLETVLGTAVGGISGTPVKDPENMLWTLRTDGTSLKARCKAGFLILFR